MRLADLAPRFAVLTFAPILLAAAACGSTGSPASPEPNGSANGRAIAPGDGTPTTPNEATLDAGAEPEIVPISTPDIVPSSLGATLSDAGIDLAKLPEEIDEFEHSQIRAVMGSFKTSLGVQCTGCHATKTMEDGGVGLDAKKPTPNRNIAEKMYSEFVVKMRFKDGAPLYCDSCHQGKADFLDRSSKEGVGKWMHENFATKLVQADGSPVNCATCHGRPFVPTFVDGWANPTVE
ncbi:MAG: cytochrome c3 family protein [Polyangiaceae bacterium]